MRKEMVIRVKTSSENHYKAIKVAAGVQGVESVTIAGEDKSLLLVIGIGVDSNKITKKLRQKVGHAEVVELRSVDSELGLASGEYAYRYHPSPSPYMHQQQPAAARDHYYAGGGGGYPRDHYYTGGVGGASTYVPSTMAAGARDYYYGGGYPAPYQQQQQHYYQAPAGNVHTVVHHEYANDPNNCSIM